ncbi:hypothetical protein B5J93_11805, partial [Moraxella equi]
VRLVYLYFIKIYAFNLFLHEKWLNLVFHNKSSFDRMTIKLHFFLEKRAIFLIFHSKHQHSTRPSQTKTTQIDEWFLMICKPIINQ